MDNQHCSTDLKRLALTATETAFQLGVSTKTVYRLCQRNLLKSSKSLRRKVILADSVEEFLKSSSMGGK